MVFFAEFFLCLNWAPVSAMLLVSGSVMTTSMCVFMLKLEWHLLPQYTIIPARRSTAEAVQILISHLLGDAISPAIVGGVSVYVCGVCVVCTCECGVVCVWCV